MKLRLTLWNQPKVRQDRISDYPGGSNVITRSLYDGGRDRGICAREYVIMKQDWSDLI